MSVSSLLGLQTALRALTAEQDAIDTTGNNIANASTAGYSRQTVDMTESLPLSFLTGSTINGDGAQLGTGVDVSSISRVRDQFLDIQYRAQNSLASGASTESQNLQQVQTALAEPSDYGISAQLQKFWSAWGDLANNPQDPAARQTVIDDGHSLADSLNALDGQLATIQSQAAQQYGTLTAANGPVASDAAQIAALNQQISQAKADGTEPNALEDQRDKLIDDLSSLGTVKVSDLGNGMVQVNFGDAASPLVGGTTVTWPQSLTSAAGGQLGSLLSLSQPGGQIDAYRSTLDGVANQLISQVNANQPAGQPFFSGTGAAGIAVAATPAGIQTSSTGQPGGNDLALAIAGLRGGSVDQGYSALVTQIGGDTASAQSTQQTSQALLSAVSNQRQSVSGVSLDEEMTNLVTFQRGYQAAARVMTTVDQMLDTLINHTGTAGL